MKTPFTYIGTRSLAESPIRFFTAAEPYQLNTDSQPLVAWPDVMKAIGVPLVRRLVVSRFVAGDQRYSIKLERGSVKAVAAHVALAVVAAWADINRMDPAIIDEFIRISAEATATWASAIAREDFAATDVDRPTAEQWIAKTAEGARDLAASALRMLLVAA